MRDLLLFALLAGAVGSSSSQTVWKTDKSHSNVKFTVSHLVVSEVSGRFKDFDATLMNTKDDFSDMQIEATIKTGSVDTDNEKRDKHLRSEDFFNAEKYPDIKFKSNKVEKAGSDMFTITGDLTIRNITKPVVLNTKFGGTVKDPWGNTKAGFRATTMIDRFEWDVKWSKAVEAGGLVVGKDVEITLLFEFAKQ
jgi:polyisoprenoid-binding protein YceI